MIYGIETLNKQRKKQLDAFLTIIGEENASQLTEKTRIAVAETSGSIRSTCFWKMHSKDMDLENLINGVNYNEACKDLVILLEEVILNDTRLYLPRRYKVEKSNGQKTYGMKYVLTSNINP